MKNSNNSEHMINIDAYFTDITGIGFMNTGYRCWWKFGNTDRTKNVLNMMKSPMSWAAKKTGKYLKKFFFCIQSWARKISEYNSEIFRFHFSSPLDLIKKI